MGRIGIGIDTGGTYTDAVAYDFDSKKVLGAAKALTTKQDLSKGIIEALDGLPGELTATPALISLSTTLATNACVENKLGRAKLVFLGGDSRVVDSHGGEYGLPKSSEMAILDSGTDFSHGVIGEVDWDSLLSDADQKFGDMDGIGVIEIYSMRNSGVVEKKAKQLLQERTGIPVVCGHELVSDLNSLQRGASTLLNASLFPAIDTFISAIRKSLAERKIDAPVVIVRSDGNLMGVEFASLRPAETLLCGPAASVIGCAELTGESDCVAVDMGGTTTDIAVVRSGRPVRAENGIGVGKWKTFIKGLYIKTIGLGGDSALHYADRQLILEDYRVVPLCIAAHSHPDVLDQLKKQLDATKKHTRYLHEGYILVRDIAQSRRYTDFERHFCQALKDGPLLRKRAAAAAGKDEYNMDVSRLVAEGVVQVFGLTPTDIMHMKGDFTRFNAEASRLGAEFVAENLEASVDSLCGMAYDAVKKRMYINIVLALLENESERYRRYGVDKSIVDLIAASFNRIQNNRGKGYVNVDFRTDLTLIGVGAPIHIFLDDVAEMLGTKAVIPEHSGVVNALGAVVGKIHAEKEIPVNPNYNIEGITGYTVFGNDQVKVFEERGAAEEYAVSEARAGALAEALRRGATGEIAMTHELFTQDGSTNSGSIYLGSKAVAHAVGAMSL